MSDMDGKRSNPIGKLLWIGVPLLLAAMVFFTVVNTRDKEIKLRNQVSALQETNKTHFDKMWKILKTQAGVLDKYKDDFKEIWVPLIEGRYTQGGGKMMQWVQERNPNFDSGMYKTLMVSIEAQRESFFQAQKKILDVKREHDDLRKATISGWILSRFGDNSEIVVQIITSGNTKEAFTTGEENDVDLFKK